jgi:dipeptidyl aminopeptidase/acylaminoacyl peptidase
MKWRNWIVAGVALITAESMVATPALAQTKQDRSEAPISQSRIGQDQTPQTRDRTLISQLPPLIDLQTLYGNPQILGAKLSPDGQYMTFIKPFEGTRHLWVKGTDDPMAAARPLTAGEQPVSSRRYRWSEDGQYVIYQQDRGGNENYHIYAVDPTAEPAANASVPKSRDLTPLDNVQARIYATPEAEPNTLIIGLNDRDPQFHDAYRLNIATGDRQFLFQNDANIYDWIADQAGNVRLAVRRTDTGGTEVLRIAEDSRQVVYRCSPQETCNVLRFHPDGERVYLTTNKGEAVDLVQLELLNPKTQTTEVVSSDPEGDVDFATALFSEATDELIATIYIGDRQRIYPQTAAFAEDLETLKAELPDGDFRFGTATEDERSRIVTVYSDVNPGITYRFNRETGAIEKLYEQRPELPTEELASMRPIRYTARDGTEIPAYLTLPQGVEPRQLPVVIYPHGGPWARDRWGYQADVQLLANRGYAVLQPNYRGSKGYGQDYLNAGNQEWGTGVMQDDVSDGVKYLIDEGIADPNRIAIYGISYGGYAALSGLAFTPDLYTAGISYVGVSNLITLLNNLPPYWAYAEGRIEMRVGDVDDPQERARLRRQSPLFHADQIDDPLLVIQGANDPRVRKAESDQIVVALRDAEPEVRYLVAPNEGHGFVREDNRLAAAAAIERFLADHLGGRHQETIPEAIQQRLKTLTVDPESVTPPEN